MPLQRGLRGQPRLCVRNECQEECGSDKDCTSKGLLCRTEAAPAAKFCAQCTVDADCPADRYCGDGVCKADECLAGHQRCGETSGCQLWLCEDHTNPLCCFYALPTARLRCKSNGSGFEYVAPVTDPSNPFPIPPVPVDSCDTSNQTCFESQGTAVCKNRVCTADTTHCNDAKTAVYECSEDGLTILKNTACGASEIARTPPACP